MNKNNATKRPPVFFSIDLEWWHYTTINDFKTWEVAKRLAHNQNNIQQSVDALLKVLAETENRITFFIISDIYQACPEVIEKIEQAGHEIAWHTHSHQILDNFDILEKELIKGKDFLAKFKPQGFRAPEILIYPEYINLLKRHGFTYSSSIYGEAVSKLDSFWEIPISTFFFRQLNPQPGDKIYPQRFDLSLLSRGIPFGGALSLAVLPSLVTNFLINKSIKKNKVINLFLHNWQIVQPPAPSFKFLLRKPFMFFYKKSMLRWFEKFCRRYQLCPLNNLIK